jgi:hypothetical protein
MEAAGWNSWANFKAFVQPHFCNWKATCRTLRKHSWVLLIALPFGIVFAALGWWRNR